MRAALIATILAASVAPLALGAESANPPLVAYALEISEPQTHFDVRAVHAATQGLRTVHFEMSRHPPPPDAECAHTLGASRFAQQYAQLATFHEQLGEFAAAIDANKSALACEPRIAEYEASIASAYLNLDRIGEARAAIERGYALDPDDRFVRDARARLDFIQERWADATARYRLLAMEPSETDAPVFNYARCFLWLAQRRAGVREPEMPEGALPTEKENGTADSAPQRWPAPILETLRGERSEADLVQHIRDTARESQPREWLTEALFYVGEQKLAEGDVETARRHFASVVNLKVLEYIEYGRARAELLKMREGKSVADAATAGTQTQAR
jgi:tetratricopeptide (TPR) repeat protein